MSLKKAELLDICYTYEHLKFHAQLSLAWKKFYNLGDWLPLMIAFWYGLILCCLAQSISFKLNRLEILECNYQDNILALFSHYLRQRKKKRKKHKL